MGMPVSFTVRPLSPACGAEIVGLDLSRNLPQQTIDEQLRFAARFGTRGARKQPPERLKARSSGTLSG